MCSAQSYVKNGVSDFIIHRILVSLSTADVRSIDSHVQHRWTILDWNWWLIERDMVIPFATGAVVGLTTGRSRVAQWLTVGVIAAGGIGAVLTACVVLIPGISSTAASLPGQFQPKLIGLLLIDTSLSLIFFTPLVLGFVIGSANSFKRDKDGWLRFSLCAMACVSAIAIGIFLASVVGD